MSAGGTAAGSVTGEAPGRVNLLGEHTDYSGGFVLPTAIPQRTRVTLSASRDGRFHLQSAATGEQLEFAPGERPPRGFGRYIHGCVAVLERMGIRVPPLEVAVSAGVPLGVGLSSSAALLVATLRALRELLGLGMDDIALAQLAQSAERDFVGVQVGILDQMACSLCDEEHMLFLDTRSLEWRLLPLPAGCAILVVDSGRRRELGSTAYNQRRAEVEEAARLLGVESLREVTDPAAARGLPSPLDRRARHVITENARVLAALDAEPAEFGRLMNASHTSLRDDFEVSVPELDALVLCLRQQAGVHGARLTGAGFGGASVALVETPRLAAASAGALIAFRKAGFQGRQLVPPPGPLPLAGAQEGQALSG